MEVGRAEKRVSKSVEREERLLAVEGDGDGVEEEGNGGNVGDV